MFDKNWVFPFKEVIPNIFYYSFVIASLPFVVTELVAVVIGRNNVNKKDVFGFGVHAGHFDLVAREHPPVELRGDRLLEMLSSDSLVKKKQLLTCQLGMSLKELA